jgi:hypothetical protein
MTPIDNPIVVDADTAEMRAVLARAEAGALLTCDEMALIWRMSARTFRRHLAAGAFDRFKVAPIGGRDLFSGELVTRYRRLEPLYVPTFGRKRGAR